MYSYYEITVNKQLYLILIFVWAHLYPFICIYKLKHTLNIKHFEKKKQTQNTFFTKEEIKNIPKEYEW